MKDSTAGGVAFVGFLLVMLGVGGVEASLDNVQLAQGFFVAVAGLATMGAGVLALKVNNESDFYK
jgi:hypothetical protein